MRSLAGVTDDAEAAQAYRDSAILWVIRLLVAHADGSLKPSRSRLWRYAMTCDWRPAGQGRAGAKP